MLISFGTDKDWSQCYPMSDRTIKAWKFNSWATPGVLTFYDTSNKLLQLETKSKIKAFGAF